MTKGSVRKIVGITALGAAVLPALWVSKAARGLPNAMGAKPPALLAAGRGSAHFVDGVYENTEPSTMLAPGGSGDLAKAAWRGRALGRAPGEIPLVRPNLPTQAGELASTWYGHSSVLIEVDGYRVLADPVWGERVSPSPTIGPKRMHEPPAPLESLPRIDAVIVSHDHYDHLDLPSIETLVKTQTAPFVVPLGLGAHLRGWGVPEDRIIELDWDGETTVGELRIVCTEARHFSGRGLKRNNTLWSSWALIGPKHRVYFGGDTGYTAAFTKIGAAYGPFDLTLLPIGAYGDQWPDIHMNPEEAVRCHADLQGGLLIPIHWATFNLAFHTWAEPANRLYAAATRADVAISVPRPGQRIDATAVPAYYDWWNDLRPKQS